MQLQGKLGAFVATILPPESGARESALPLPEFSPEDLLQ